jgi:hypothetical protein
MSAAALLDDVLRQDRVPDRLRHFLAVDIDEKAVGEHLSIRRPTTRAETTSSEL